MAGKSQPGGLSVNWISLKLNDGLRELVAQQADKLDLPMNEVIVHILAEHFGRKDLATVPRKRPGRHRKEKETAKAS